MYDVRLTSSENVSDAYDPRDILAAAPLDIWGPEMDRIPLAVIPCLGLWYDRNGFPTYTSGDAPE
jgi:hypothetical protein